MARDVLGLSCMCASGELHLHLSKPIRRDQLAAVLARFTGEAPGPAEECGSALDQGAALATPGATGS